MDNGTIMGAIGMITAIIGAIIAAVNHKRLRSRCCGRQMDVAIDIENTTPPKANAPPPPITAPST